MTFRRNVGGIDRGLRLAAGSVLLSIGLYMVTHGCPCGWVNVAFGLVGLVTGLTGFCGLYLPFGISTVRSARRAAR